MMRLLGFRLGAPTLTPIPGGGGLSDLRASAVPRYLVRTAYASRSAEREGRAEGLCGDSVALFRSADGRSFALLSDGMGSGRNAAELSGICTVFLQKMLSAGGDTGVILKMLNDFLVAGPAGESSATVDLLELDLYTGEGIFWKSGAAPTFILREGNLLRLSSRTAPAGILPEADVQKTEFQLYHGDVVVMLSDGVADEGEELDLTAEMFAEITGALVSEDLSGAYSDGTDAALERLAARIADGGVPEGGKRDDRTVILVRVEEDGASDAETDACVAG